MERDLKFLAKLRFFGIVGKIAFLGFRVWGFEILKKRILGFRVNFCHFRRVYDLIFAIFAIFVGFRI